MNLFYQITTITHKMMFLLCSFKKHYKFGMHVLGAMLQSETPAELGAILHNVAGCVVQPMKTKREKATIF